MRLAVILSAIVVLILAASCSSPSPDAQNYLSKNNVAVTNGTSSDVVDVTAQSASALPTGALKNVAPPEDKFKQTVSPGQLPKCVDQFAGTQKVWEKMKEMKDHYGSNPFMFELGDRGFINGNPLSDMKAAVSPVPLFDTWDTSKINGVEKVDNFISHGAPVKVKSRRSTPEGNWYLVTIVSVGIENVKGWVPEKLLSSTRAMPSTVRIGGFTGGSCSTGG